MPHVDARAISRIAQNPRCQRQAAFHLLSLSEQEAYALLAGQPYPGDRGERTAALVWGHLFEARLCENGARRLLGALEGVVGTQAESATVRDLRAEVPGTEPEVLAERTRRTRAILAELLTGRPIPDLLLQPPLVLSWGGVDWGTIVPDALVLDRRRGRYLPLEAKSFIGIDGMITPSERTTLRLQAAVEIVALRSELARLGAESMGLPEALLVVATPFGFRPAGAVLEDLEAEVAAVHVALRTVARVISRFAADQQPSLRETLTRLPPHFQESCLVSCALAEHCRPRAPEVRAAVGDLAARLLGEDLDLARVIALLAGDPPATPHEVALQEALHETIALYRWKVC